MVKYRRRKSARRGAYLVLFVATMVILLGVLALIHDVALVHYTTRMCQNAADAAALAGGRKLADGKSASAARSKASEYLITHHQMNSVRDDIKCPPGSGAYSGVRGYIQVTARKEISPLLLRAPSFWNSPFVVQASAVAGDEYFVPDPVFSTLNPNARPGLSVSPTSVFRVFGRIAVNSEGGGLDENGIPINNGSTGTAISVGLTTADKGIYAEMIDAVGGVDRLVGLKPLDPEGYAPLRTRIPAIADPYINLPTPMQSNGVDIRFRGSVTVTSTTVLGLSGDVSGQNRIATHSESIAGGLYQVAPGDVVLHPGVYGRLWISGGRVFLIPGIYVLSPRSTFFESIRINGGSVTAEGIMFYTTGENFNATTGEPDIYDLATSPPETPTTNFMPTSMIAGLQATPIDTNRYNYGALYSGARNISSSFNGIVFYQRRHNTEQLLLTGNNTQAGLMGTVYGKWMPLRISGAAKYGAKFFTANTLILGGSNIEIQTGQTETAAFGRSAFLVQ
jgi:hypothetical protein